MSSRPYKALRGEGRCLGTGMRGVTAMIVRGEGRRGTTGRRGRRLGGDVRTCPLSLRAGEHRAEVRRRHGARVIAQHHFDALGLEGFRTESCDGRSRARHVHVNVVRSVVAISGRARHGQGEEVGVPRARNSPQSPTRPWSSSSAASAPPRRRSHRGLGRAAARWARARARADRPARRPPRRCGRRARSPTDGRKARAAGSSSSAAASEGERVSARCISRASLAFPFLAILGEVCSPSRWRADPCSQPYYGVPAQRVGGGDCRSTTNFVKGDDQLRPQRACAHEQTAATSARTGQTYLSIRIFGDPYPPVRFHDVR